jgi:tRNA threonylcarbamoyladenosine biosynthesis protein TsaE
MSERIINSPEEMKRFAAEVASGAKAGDIFCLTGSLGAGKTTFAQGFIESLQDIREPVTSPTFNLVQVYKTRKTPIYHCDLYRLKNEGEFYNLGLDDAFDSAIVLIEWPQVARHLLPRDSKNITIETINDTSRKVTLS